MEEGTARGSASPSEGGAEVLRGGKAHGERCKARADMHVRFACNITANPLYPKPCLFTPPHQSNNVPVLAGITPVNSEVSFSHLMSERRIGRGLPLKNETPASGSAMNGDSTHTSIKRRSRSAHSTVPTCGPVEAGDTCMQSGSVNRAMSGPPTCDPEGDMDCSEDQINTCLIPSAEAEASMPLTTDAVAHHKQSAVVTCEVVHGLGVHDSHDSKLEACSPYPDTPILLPDEWLAAYQSMSEIARLQRLGQTGTHPSIIPGCASFASCIDLSRAYAIKIDIHAIEGTAQTLLAAGKGIDYDMMSGHMA
jgi:hypothetical protein